MLKILKRKAARGGVKRLREYFEGDFQSAMWDAAKGSAVEIGPLVARFEPEATKLPIWQPLKEAEFHGALSALKPKEADSVLAFELALAPPKSFSLAALAGGDLINTRLLQIHSKAAAQAYRLVSGFFMTRREEDGRKFLEPVPVQVWRFPHPWNRAVEPQLHEHHIILASGEHGALHGYPLYSHLRAFRAAYHYTLVAELREAGYALRIGPPGSLIWEINGVSPEQMQLFSERQKRMQEFASTIAGRYYSQGLAMQYAAFETRKELPKTDPLVSLRDQRRSWLNRLIASPVRVHRQDPGIRRVLVGDLTKYFHASATQTPLSVAGAVLAAALGGTDSVQTVLDAVRRELDAEIERGDVVAGEHQTICHRRVFRAEEQLRSRQRLRAPTYDPGDVQFESHAPAGNLARRKLLHALSRPSAVKVLALGADTRPEVVSSSLRLPEFIRFPQWNPFAVLLELSRRRAQHVCLEVGQEPYAHDFLGTLVKGPWKSPPSSSSIFDASRLFLGSTAFEIEHFPDWDGPPLKRCLFGADDGGSSVVWVREEKRENYALAEKLMEWEQSRLGGRSKEAELLINHSLQFGGGRDKRGLFLYFKKRFGSFPRHSQARLHAGSPNDFLKAILESPKGVMMELTVGERAKLLELAKAGVDVFFASFEKVRLREGQQLQAGMDFNGGSWKVKRGELVRFEGFEDDDAIRLADGRVLRGDVIPLQPAVAVHELAPRAHGCDRVVVFGHPDRQLLEHLKHARRKVIFVVDSPDSIEPAREIIAEWVEDRLLAMREASVARPGEAHQDSAEWGHNLFGHREIWRKLAGLQTELKKVIDVRSPFWLRLLDRQRAFISRLAKARSKLGEPQRVVVKPPPGPTVVVDEQTMG